MESRREGEKEIAERMERAEGERGWSSSWVSGAGSGSNLYTL